MNKKRFKKFVEVLIALLLVGYALVQYPTAREPILQLIAIIVIMRIVIWLLKGKDKKEKKHPEMYGKIPTGAILVVIIIVAIVAIKVMAPTLTPFAVVAGFILTIFIGYRITKDVKKDLENDNNSDNIVEFKKPKR